MTLFPMILAAAMLTPQESELKAKLPEIFAKSAAHYRALDAAATPLMHNDKGEALMPQGWNKWKTGRDELDMREIHWWTSGHFAGSFWLLYAATGRPRPCVPFTTPRPSPPPGSWGTGSSCRFSLELFCDARMIPNPRRRVYCDFLKFRCVS